MVMRRDELADTMPVMRDAPRRIAVFLPNWVGDAVMFTPTLRAIRARLGGARLMLVGRPAPTAVLTPNPWTDEVAVLRRGTALRLICSLRSQRFDLAVLGPNSFRSALVARAAGARRRLGYDRDGRGMLLTDKLDPARGPDGRLAVTPAVDYYLKLAEHLGCDVSDRRMELSVGEADAASAETMRRRAGVEEGRPVVLINPGAAFGPAKLYPAERFAAVADGLVEARGAQIIINAAPGERPIAEAVEGRMKHAPVLNLARIDNTIGLLKAFVRRADLVITNDTGPRHFAVAFGRAVVTIFGPTDPERTKTYCDRERIVRVDVPCGPCQCKRCPLPEGPSRHQCMLGISPEMVVAAGKELLDRGADA